MMASFSNLKQIFLVSSFSMPRNPGIVYQFSRFCSQKIPNDGSKKNLSDIREKARQKITEIDNEQSLSPNSPIGLMDRSPRGDLNNHKEDICARTPNPAFDPFPNNINPKTGEVDGPTGPEPTRYGDWERKGRCSDF